MIEAGWVHRVEDGREVWEDPEMQRLQLILDEEEFVRERCALEWDRYELQMHQLVGSFEEDRVFRELREEYQDMIRQLESAERRASAAERRAQEVASSGAESKESEWRRRAEEAERRLAKMERESESVSERRKQREWLKQKTRKLLSEMDAEEASVSRQERRVSNTDKLQELLGQLTENGEGLKEGAGPVEMQPMAVPDLALSSEEEGGGRKSLEARDRARRLKRLRRVSQEAVSFDFSRDLDAEAEAEEEMPYMSDGGDARKEEVPRKLVKKGRGGGVAGGNVGGKKRGRPRKADTETLPSTSSGATTGASSSSGATTGAPSSSSSGAKRGRKPKMSAIQQAITKADRVSRMNKMQDASVASREKKDGKSVREGLELRSERAENDQEKEEQSQAEDGLSEVQKTPPRPPSRKAKASPDLRQVTQMLQKSSGVGRGLRPMTRGRGRGRGGAGRGRRPTPKGPPAGGNSFLDTFMKNGTSSIPKLK